MKTGYLRKYFPPFPCLPIRMGYPSEGFRLGPIEALIDTGADGSLVPQSLLDELGAPLVDQVRVRSQWGETHSANLYTVDLGIAELRLPAIEVIGDPGTEIILGRDVLNRLRLLLDGPSLEATLLDVE